MSSEDRLARLGGGITELRERVSKVEERLEELSGRIDDINHSLSKRIDDLHRTITAWFTVITILMIFSTAILPMLLRHFGF